MNNSIQRLCVFGQSFQCYVDVDIRIAGTRAARNLYTCVCPRAKLQILQDRCQAVREGLGVGSAFEGRC